MNKAEVIDGVAGRAGLSKREASDAVDAILATIEDTLRRGGEVRLAGFGTFSVSSRQARSGRNPATGEEIRIAAAAVPRFRPAGNLRAAIGGVPGDPDTCY